MPEKREEVTTEGGLDLMSNRKARGAKRSRKLRDAGIGVSLFLDPDARQIDAAAELGVDAVELHTGQYAWRPATNRRAAELAKLAAAARQVRSLGLDAARRPRSDLSQREADRRDRRHVGAEHRPQHRRPGDHGGLRASGARDEEASFPKRVWRFRSRVVRLTALRGAVADCRAGRDKVYDATTSTERDI